MHRLSCIRTIFRTFLEKIVFAASLFLRSISSSYLLLLVLLHCRRLVERALTHVVFKAVLGGFLAQDPANTKYIACIVDVSYEWNFLSGPCRRLGVSLDF